MKEKLKIVLFAYLFFISNLLSQSIKVTIINSPNQATLLFQEGEESHLIDSTNSINSTFEFPLKGKHQGFYRIEFDKRHFVDFVNDSKNIELKTYYKNIVDSLKVDVSESNKLFYKFLKINKDFKSKTELLNVILQRYPKNDDFYSTTINKLKELQIEYSEFVKSTSQDEHNSFIARYIRSAQLPIVDGTLPFEKQIQYLKSHALDNVDFTDDKLTYSNLFTSKSIEYLMYYRNPQMPKPLLEDEFEKAVDTLLNKAKVSEFVYQHITEYLIDGFAKFGFDSIINYIVDNYVIKDDLCLGAKVESSIQKRIDQAKNFKIGSKVPNIILPDTSGSMIDVSKIKADKILLLFYASWCPHCKDKLPELVELYNTQKNKKIEIVAISIDSKREDWIEIIKKHRINFINVSDLKGWDGKATLDFDIYATPTMFLINKERKIISKPLTLEEIKKIFRENE